MDPGSGCSGWGSCGNLHFHVGGDAGDTAWIQLRGRGHQQHGYGVADGERGTLLVVHPGSGWVFASSAANLGVAIWLSGSTKPRILPCCGDVSIGSAEVCVYVVGIADFYRLVLTERHRRANAKA